MQGPTKSRCLGRYSFEDGGVIEISCSGSVDTATALDIVATLIDLKRKEIGKGRLPAALKAATG